MKTLALIGLILIIYHLVNLYKKNREKEERKKWFWDRFRSRGEKILDEYASLNWVVNSNMFLNRIPDVILYEKIRDEYFRFEISFPNGRVLEITHFKFDPPSGVINSGFVDAETIGKDTTWILRIETESGYMVEFMHFSTLEEAFTVSEEFFYEEKDNNLN